MGRLLAGFLSFLVSIQLSVGQHTLVLVDTAQAQTCAAGQKLDPIMGRCLSTEQASQVASATSNCAGAGDEAAQKKCYLDQAQAALADAEAKGDVKAAGSKQGGDMMGMLLSLGGLMSGVSFLAKGGGAVCGPRRMSAIILSASSVAAFMGEVLAAETYKKKMKEAETLLKKINEGSAGTTKTGASSNVMNATNVQEEAFKALIKKEEAVIAAAATKKSLYMLATAGYAAAMVLAGFESIPIPPGADLCAASIEHPLKDTSVAVAYVDNYFQKNQRVSFDSYLNMHNLKTAEKFEDLQASVIEMEMVRAGHTSLTQVELNAIERIKQQKIKLSRDEVTTLGGLYAMAHQFTISSAVASPLMSLGLGAGATAGAVLAAGETLSKLYMSATTRLVLGGVLTGYALLSIVKAGKEAGKAKDRKAFLEKLKAQVATAGNGINCGSADAAQASANCQSTGANTINPQGATNSSLLAANFGVDPTAVDPALAVPRCITKSGSYDSTCACKATNNCLTIGSTIGGGLPAGISLGSIPSDLDAITSGKISASQLDQSALESGAARLNKLNENIAKKNPSIKSALEKAKKEALAVDQKLRSQIGASSALAASASGNQEDGALSAKSPEEALEQLKQELSQEIGKVESKATAEGTPSALDLSGLSDETEETPSATEATDKLAENMASEFDMGNNDINTETTTSIFDIVSNRYKRSGIRRLLGSEQLIPADGAASSDINR